MLAQAKSLRLVLAAAVMFWAVRPVAAQESVRAPASAAVLVAPVQGSAGLRAGLGERVSAAVRRALLARGYRETVSQDLLGQTVVACQTPECVKQALDAAGAAFAIVPAIWSRDGGGEELTLTLVQRSGRSLNASGAAKEDLAGNVTRLVEKLLAKQAAGAASVAAPVATSPREVDAARHQWALEPKHPHAWKAGPILLIAGGAAALIAVGVGAGVQSDSQQLNAAAVAAWSSIGAAAIAGGIAWWVVGEKKRPKRAGESAHARAPAINLRPTGIDVRLRF